VRVLSVFLVLLSLVSLTGAINPFHHDRQALSAFLQFRHNPSLETEAAWIAARDRGMRREMTLRGIFLALALGAGIGAVVSWKKSGQRRLAKVAPKKVRRKGLGCVWGGLVLFGILAALAFVATAARLRARLGAWEAGAIGGAREIAKAQAQFFEDHDRYASPEALVEAGLLQTQWRECAPSCNMGGYSWEFRLTEQGFEALAVPLQYSRTGVRSSLLTFDFVHEVIAHLELPEDLHLIPYDWTHYPVNIERIDTALSQLHINGDSEVTLVVEGNPEVYDLLSCLSLAGRNIRFEVIAPAVVLCCRWVEERYGVGIASPSYVIVSGFNARHGVTTSQLAAEIDAYLCLDLTCLVIELFSGDLPIVLERVYAAERRKVVVAMMDMFTPNQQVVVFQAAELADSDCVDRIKSKFTSLAIVDESRLQGTPEPYARMLSELAAPAL